MAKPITVKCYLSTFRNEGVEIRRFLYKDTNDPTIEQLKQCVEELYPQLRGQKFELMYLDEDNDKVAVTSDQELWLGWTEARSTCSQFRVYIHVS